MTPNWSLTFALIFWPVVALYLYQTRPVNQATLWTILGGFLLLPVGAGIKFEMVPQFDKVSIPNLAALIGCMLVLRGTPRLWYGFGLPGRPRAHRGDDRCCEIGRRGAWRLPQNSLRPGATAPGTCVPPPPVRLGAVWTEQNLAKLKAELRRLAARAVATVKDALGDLPDRSPRAKCAKHIANADNVKFNLTKSGELLVRRRKAQA
jgi:hypothetical protein